MQDILNNLTAFFANSPDWVGYTLLTVWLLLESAGIPLPNEIVLLFAGFLANQGFYNLEQVIFFSILGSMMGVVISYAMGYTLGDKIISMIATTKAYASHRESVQDWLHKKSLGIFIFTRFIPFVRVYISFFAGLNKINPLRFFIESFIGTTIWNIGLVTIGYFVGSEYARILAFFHKYTLYAVAVLILIIAGYVYFHFFYGKEKDIK